MAETPTSRLGLLDPNVGEDVDTWGGVLNGNFVRLDEAIRGVLSLAVSGDLSIVNTLDATDQNHFAVLNIVGGSGGRVILPQVQGVLTVRNGSAGSVTVLNSTSAPSSTVTLQPGSLTQVVNDGVSSCYEIGPGSGLKSYIDNVLTTSKAYTDSAALSAQNGSFPAQSGNAGKYFTTDGTNVLWKQISVADVAGLAQQLAQAKAFAIAAAVVL